MKLYYYVFYKLYKFWEQVSVPKFWSDVKASLSIDLLVLFAVSSVFFYFDISFGDKTVFLACLILMLFVSNYFLLKETVWREYINYFENLPRSKNRKGGVLVWSIILLILLSFIHSIYWMDQRARKNQTGPYSKEYLNSKATQ